MPSPFPGMDPFLENQEWSDFHVSAMCVMSELLAPLIAPHFVARLQRRVAGDSFDISRNQRCLVIRSLPGRRAVTTINLLSPDDKSRRTRGRERYLDIRQELLVSDCQLVEIDLLRGGDRLPAEDPLPAADYFAIVSRADERPVCNCWAWRLDVRLPVIPIPLANSHQDAELDLQLVMDTVYSRARYDVSLDYSQPLVPPLPDNQNEWVRKVLSSRGGR